MPDAHGKHRSFRTMTFSAIMARQKARAGDATSSECPSIEVCPHSHELESLRSAAIATKYLRKGKGSPAGSPASIIIDEKQTEATQEQSHSPSSHAGIVFSAEHARLSWPALESSGEAIQYTVVLERLDQDPQGPPIAEASMQATNTRRAAGGMALLVVAGGLGAIAAAAVGGATLCLMRRGVEVLSAGAEDNSNGADTLLTGMISRSQTIGPISYHECTLSGLEPGQHYRAHVRAQESCGDVLECGMIEFLGPG
jgi:hypothetical protein